jgi:HAD superfamily phosphatase (TIGR01668 family)
VLQPDHYYTSVHAIDLGGLRAEGVRALLLDLDNTLLPRNESVLSEEVRQWAARVTAEGFGVCLVSNNWHARVHGVASELGFHLVSKALKPLPFAFRKAMRLLAVTPEHAAVVGDQLFTDVLGGKLSGARTVLVEPMSEADLPHTLFLRLIESRVLADREPAA